MVPEYLCKTPIPLQLGIVYGPLESRRFGASLGINVLPTTKKICNFDCVYCQYGQSVSNDRPIFPAVQEIQIEVALALSEAKRENRPLDWLMIAGNGEPTLHPEFPRIVDSLISLRNELYPGLPIGILSNSSTCAQPRIQEALLKLEGRFMKLDAGAKLLFYEINQPANSARWEEIIAGLYHLRSFIMQSLFFTGVAQNVSDSFIDDWIVAVKYIQPKSVQIYTIDRPTRDEGLLPVCGEVLDSIAKRLFERTGIQGLVFTKEMC